MSRGRESSRIWCARRWVPWRLGRMPRIAVRRGVGRPEPGGGGVRAMPTPPVRWSERTRSAHRKKGNGVRGEGLTPSSRWPGPRSRRDSARRTPRRPAPGVYRRVTARATSTAPFRASAITSARSARVLAPYEPMMLTPRRTSGVISTGAVEPAAAIPTITARPPARTILVACTNVSGRPERLERHIHAPAIRQVADARADIFLRAVDGVRRAKLPGGSQLVVAHVDSDHRIRSERPRQLNDVRADAARRHHGHRLARPELRTAPHGPVRREDGAAQDGGLLERQIVRQRGHA